MPSVAHNLERKVDRMAHVPDRAHASGSQLGALHHPGIQLDFTLQVQTGTDSCIEKRLVFEVPHRGDGGRQGARADQGPSCSQRSIDGGLPERTFGDRDRSRAAVDDECRLSYAARAQARTRGARERGVPLSAGRMDKGFGGQPLRGPDPASHRTGARRQNAVRRLAARLPWAPKFRLSPSHPLPEYSSRSC
jgi:hypothetical protein